MLSTTEFSRGDVVLVNFVFTEGTGSRRRPVVLMSSDAYHRGRQEAIVAAITSNTERLLVGDSVVGDWRAAGLLFPSVVTGILRTIKQNMVTRKLGSLSQDDMENVQNEVKLSLGLAG